MGLWSPLHRRRPVRWLLAAFFITLCLLYTIPPNSGIDSWHHGRFESLRGQTQSERTSQKNKFSAFPFIGFVNTGLPGKQSCESLQRSTVIGVDKGRVLKDDIRQIRSQLESHPLVVDAYAEKKDGSVEEQENIRKSWARMAGSSVWLPDQQVFLVVTRVTFFAHGNVQWPFRSWLRGQVYDANWKHLDNYKITWQGNAVIFPTVFDIPIDYQKGGIFYGPEDPRVILEEGVDGAEPVIIYNMITERFTWFRVMYTYRPFSKVSTMLTIVGKPIAETEKNWAPFFLPSEHNGPRNPRQPSQYLHFVHDFSPLHILRCDLVSGDCEYTFEQTLDGGVALIRGGTNWVAVPGLEDIETRDHHSVRAWVSFPRTMVEKTCGERFYRPELMVMVNVGQAFYIAYVSAPLDFGTSLVTIKADDNPCEKGRILIPNSIARWETEPGKPDIMTLTLSVNDLSNQVVKLEGLLEFIYTLPLIQVLRQSRKYGLVEDYDDLHTKMLYAKGAALLDCSVEMAVEQAKAIRMLYGLPDPREEERKEEEKKKAAEEDKRKEEEREEEQAKSKDEKEEAKAKQEQTEAVQKTAEQEGDASQVELI